jgi:hypothetical protein
MAIKESCRSPARLQNAGRELASRLLTEAWFGAATPMTIQQDVDALRARMDKVQLECDAWYAAGRKEKYLESYFLLEALSRQLDECLKHLPAELPAT